MVSSVAGPAWEKQALNHAIRITRGTPQTVRRIFERAARQHDKQPARPPCTCHQAADVPGTKVLIDGHLALVPLMIPFSDGKEARPNDPLPLPGKKVRERVLKDISTVATHISATLPPLHRLLSPPLWPETGTRLRYISNYAARIMQHFYVRIVDKGVGVLWTFCHWV